MMKHRIKFTRHSTRDKSPIRSVHAIKSKEAVEFYTITKEKNKKRTKNWIKDKHLVEISASLIYQNITIKVDFRIEQTNYTKSYELPADYVYNTLYLQPK